MCGSLGLGWLPLILGFLSIGTFSATYIIAVAKGDVSPLFPYISDTGTKRPESCIFGQFLNISAAIAAVVMYCRYALVKNLVHQTIPRVQKINVAALVIGMLSSLGMSMVANFQETAVEAIHFTGAALVFGMGTLYCLLHSIISYKMYPDYCGRRIAHWRLFITLVAGVSMMGGILRNTKKHLNSASAFIAGAISREQWTNGGHKIDDHKSNWGPDDHGYAWHLVSTFSEWIMSVAFLLYFFTYVRDFSKLHLSVNTRVLVVHLDDTIIVGPPSERTGLLT